MGLAPITSSRGVRLLTISQRALEMTRSLALGNDKIGGGAGFDVAVFSGSRSSYTISEIDFYWHEIKGPDGLDVLVDIDRLQFSDQVLDITPYAQVLTAHAGVLRASPSEDLATVDQAKIGAGQISLQNYVRRLIVLETLSLNDTGADRCTIYGRSYPYCGTAGRACCLTTDIIFGNGCCGSRFGSFRSVRNGLFRNTSDSQKFGSLADRDFLPIILRHSAVHQLQSKLTIFKLRLVISPIST